MLIKHATARLSLLASLKQDARRLAHLQTLRETLPSGSFLGDDLLKTLLSQPACQTRLLQEILVFLVKFGSLPTPHEQYILLQFCARLAQRVHESTPQERVVPPMPPLRHGDPLVEAVIEEVIRLGA